MPCWYVISKDRPGHQMLVVKGLATCALQGEVKGERKASHSHCGSLVIVMETKVPAVPLRHPAIVVNLDNAQEI